MANRAKPTTMERLMVCMVLGEYVGPSDCEGADGNFLAEQATARQDFQNDSVLQYLRERDVVVSTRSRLPFVQT